jgi:hypothetical protein
MTKLRHETREGCVSGLGIDYGQARTNLTKDFLAIWGDDARPRPVRLFEVPQSQARVRRHFDDLKIKA